MKTLRRLAMLFTGMVFCSACLLAVWFLGQGFGSAVDCAKGALLLVLVPALLTVLCFQAVASCTGTLLHEFPPAPLILLGSIITAAGGVFGGFALVLNALSDP